MEKNKITSIVVTLSLFVFCFNGNTLSWNKSMAAEKNTTSAQSVTFKKNRLPVNSKKDRYIIVTKEKETVTAISDKFTETKKSKFSQIAKKKNIISVKMTGREANELLESKDVLCVELDSDVTGCGTEAEPGQITEKNQKSWNQKMLRISEEKENVSSRVKVAVIDSGIDYGNDINYKEQINLIPGEEELSPFFVDATGHGTSVAGIIAAEDNDRGITGINPDIELYSAKVLTEDNKAPVSRVVEGIYWAIDNHVNIINMSFSTTYDSQILKKAVEDASRAGILIIAAAGNNSEIEYPAAYPQVIAVGSINAEGEKADKSASGEELELVAPGEKITSSGLLHGTIVESGTSLAAPHVTGVASLLWQKDMSVSADFIRGLLTASANSCGSENDYGKGIVDYAYALSIYDEYKNAYKKRPSDTEYTIPENTNEVQVFEENNAVEGQWEDHAGMAKSAGAIVSFQQGAAEPDKTSSGLDNLKEHHPWHGGRFANYAADYRYVEKVANAVGNLGTSATKANIVSAIKGVAESPGMDGSHIMYDHKHMSYYKGDGVYLQMQKELCNNIADNLVGKTSNEKKGYVFGLASHIATDAFAHASYRYDGSSWIYIDHLNDEEKKDLDANQKPKEEWRDADNKKCVKKRISSAKAVLDKIIDRFNGKRSNIAVVRDFLISKTTVSPENREYYNSQSIKYTKNDQNDDATYRMHKMKTYLNTAGESDSDVLKVYEKVSYN